MTKPVKRSDKKAYHQVFVSSTYKDLIEERKEVIQALLELHCIPVGMEIFPAAAKDQWTIIKKLIDECDYYILILAGRYGTLNDEAQLSYTELEYNYAIKKRIPVISFLHEDINNIPKSKIETEPDFQKKLDAFKEKAQKLLCRKYDNPKTLRAVVSSSLYSLMIDKPRPGLIRLTNKEKEALDELPILKEKYASLEKESKKSEDIIVEFEEMIVELTQKAKYFEAFPLLNHLFSLVHSSLRHPEERFEDSIITLKEVCTALKQIFDKITGQQCHVCIKTYMAEANGTKTGEPRIETMVRDTLSPNRKTSIDYEKVSVPLPSQNTAFEYLLNNIQSDRGKFFFSNDITSIANYKNSSFMRHTGTYEFSVKPSRERDANWPLPYKSTIVAPICPSIHKEKTENNLAGFLCLDAHGKDAFNVMDSEILIGCADGIYNLIKNIVNKSNNEGR